MNKYKNKLKGIDFDTNIPIEITIKEDKIVQVCKIQADSNNLPIIAPGFVDLQVNGYKGIDFNSQQTTESEWKNIIGSLAEVGVTEFYPTFITNSFEQLMSNFQAAENALASLPEHALFVGGYHLEGPYLSKENGPRGAHDAAFIKAPNWEEFCRLQESANGRIKLLTLSPEWKKSETFIQKVVHSGVKVAIGHTAASSEQIERAVAAGATLSTHLGNGAHIQLPRHPNYIWDQLAHDELFTTVIADGHHLPKNVLHVIHKIKKDKMLIISDSVALAGMPPGDYTTAVGGDVTLTNTGRLHLQNEERLLAGSAQNIWQGVQYLASAQICSFNEAIKKASIYPGNFIQTKQKTGLMVGANADLILINPNKASIIRTIKAGKTFFKAGGDE